MLRSHGAVVRIHAHAQTATRMHCSRSRHSDMAALSSLPSSSSAAVNASTATNAVATKPITTLKPTLTLLPHQLVARDARSTYIQRVHTLAGPGAYVIPSTFKQTPLNDRLRDVQQQLYGREFARQQRQQTDKRLEHESGLVSATTIAVGVAASGATRHA